MNDTKTISFSMDAAGQLRAADFKPRSLKKVLEAELGEDWKKSPKKLLKAMTRVSDLYTVIFAARQRMISEYIAKYEALHDKVRELSAQGLKALELTKDGLPSQDDLDAAQSNDVFELYAETRRDALRCHRALSLMQKSSLTDWVERMDKTEFKALTATAKTLLERNIRKSDSLFCALKDSPEGAALAVLMDIPPASLKPFGFSQTMLGDVTCAVVSDRKAFKSWCEEQGFEFSEITAAEKSRTPVPQKSAEVEKKAEKPAKPAKITKTAVKPQENLTVKIIKTEAKLATSKPKAAAPAKASPAVKSAASASSVDDLASRLVSSLQIAPSAVEHRSPGRPARTPPNPLPFRRASRRQFPLVRLRATSPAATIRHNTSHGSLRLRRRSARRRAEPFDQRSSGHAL